MKFIIFLLTVLTNFVDKFEMVNGNTGEEDCGIRPGYSRAISDGIKVTSNTEQPWYVLLTLFTYEHKHFYCGGSLIAMNYVLTAAHCVETNVLVILASFGADHREAKKDPNKIVRRGFIHAVHPHFHTIDLGYSYNDIAVLKVAPLMFIPRVWPICVTERYDDYPQNQNGTVLGYGETNPPSSNLADKLRKGFMAVAEQGKCEDYFKHIGEYTGSAVCLKGNPQSACAGDSGGPYIVWETREGKQTAVLAGIISDGSECSMQNGITVVVNLPHMLKWIKENIIKKDSCGVVPSFQKAIINGIAVQEYEHPWFVALNTSNSTTWMCGGSLTTNTHIISSALCLDGHKDNIVAILGSITREPEEYGAVYRKAEIFAIHPKFRRLGSGLDIAILKIGFVYYSSKIFPICLPWYPFNHGNLATVLGFGRTKGNDETSLSHVLRKADNIKIMTPYGCNRSLSDNFNLIMDQTEMCGINDQSTFCYGDGGGPLIVMEELYGEKVAVLFGIANQVTQVSCDPASGPFTYTNVSFMIHWIYQVTDRHQCGVSQGFKTAIIEGEKVDENEQPWFVLLEFHNPDDADKPYWEFGGSLINDKYILTSAQRITIAKKIYAIMGTVTRKLTADAINVTANIFLVHPKYKPGHIGYDIAILEIDPVKLVPWIYPVCLPIDLQYFDNQDGIILGFGATKVGDEHSKSNELLKGKVRILNKRDCEEMTLKDTEMCTTSIDNAGICYGDQGGPVVVEVYYRALPTIVIAGIASAITTTNCEPSEAPRIFTNVSFLLQWIRNETKIS